MDAPLSTTATQSIMALTISSSASIGPGGDPSTAVLGFECEPSSERLPGVSLGG